MLSIIFKFYLKRDIVFYVINAKGIVRHWWESILALRRCTGSLLLLLLETVVAALWAGSLTIVGIASLLVATLLVIAVTPLRLAFLLSHNMPLPSGSVPA